MIENTKHFNPFTNTQTSERVTITVDISEYTTTNNYIQVDTGYIVKNFSNAEVYVNSKRSVVSGEDIPTKGYYDIKTKLTPSTKLVGSYSIPSVSDIFEVVNGFAQGSLYISTAWISTPEIYNDGMLISGSMNTITITFDVISQCVTGTLINKICNDFTIGAYKYSLERDDHGSWMKCDGRLIPRSIYSGLTINTNFDTAPFYLSSDNTAVKSTYIRLPNQNDTAFITGCNSNRYKFDNPNLTTGLRYWNLYPEKLSGKENFELMIHTHDTVLGSHTHDNGMSEINVRKGNDNYYKLPLVTVTTSSVDLGTKLSSTTSGSDHVPKRLTTNLFIKVK